MSYLKNCSIVIIFILVLFPNRSFPISVSGDISGKWEKKNNPYIVTGDVRIPPYQSLEIEAGVQVLFNGFYFFRISKGATLKAIGSEDDLIIFKPKSSKISWRGLRFDTSDKSSTLSYCLIVEGYASGEGEYNNGGAIYLKYSDITITNCNISKNEAYGDGGAIFCLYSNAIIKNNLIISNISSLYGGGVYCNLSDPKIIENIFSFNYALFNGGAIYCYFSSPDILGNYFLQNQTQDHGGGICGVGQSSPRVCNNILISNISKYSFGGGIYFANYENSEISDNIFAFNYAYDLGGGIMLTVANTNFTISRNIFWGNYAGAMGGGIALDRAYPSVFAHNTIYLNESEYGGGLALLDLTKEDTLKITNSLIWNNKADYYPSICSNGNTEVTYSDIQGGWQGTGNIDKDPFFVNEEDGNFHLQMPSPCIDSGDPLSPKDPDGSISDIGAYYFNQEITPSIELYNRYDMFLRPFEQAYFDLWIYNLADTIATFDFWGFLISNEGKKIGPLSMKKNLQIKPENCLGKNHIPLSIPWNLPSGAYSIIGYIGKYPLSTDSSSFQIIKNDSENYIKSDRIPINPINLPYLY